VATQSRPPTDHYGEAERLLAAAAESSVTDSIQVVTALTAIGHALLATVPPRRAPRRQPPPPPRPHGGSPQQRWLYGDDAEPAGGG
jgi:hypothetical protein